MSDEEHEDELTAMGAGKTSPRMIVWAVVAGAIVAIVLALASHYAAERDRASEPTRSAAQDR